MIEVAALSAVIWSALATKALGTACVGLGWRVAAIPWESVGLIWRYCLIWLFIEDWAKLMVYDRLALDWSHHRRFFGRVNRLLHPQSAGFGIR